ATTSQAARFAIIERRRLLSALATSADLKQAQPPVGGLKCARNPSSWCRQESGWKLGRHRLREFEDIGLGGEVNWLRDGLFSDGFPSVDFAHADLAGGKQGPEQHPGGFC